jgi:hypothetical protein
MFTLMQVQLLNLFLDVVYSVSEDEQIIYDTLEITLTEVELKLNSYLFNTILILVFLIIYGIMSIVISHKYEK